MVQFVVLRARCLLEIQNISNQKTRKSEQATIVKVFWGSNSPGLAFLKSLDKVFRVELWEKELKNQ